MSTVAERADLVERLGVGGPVAWRLVEDFLGGDPGSRTRSLHALKPPRVYRWEFAPGSPWGSLVLKRLEPVVAQRVRLVAERWLPDLGLADHCPRLLGIAAEQAGESVWLAYEDLGDVTLAERAGPEELAAVVELVAELHVRAARHRLLPDARRYCTARGMEYFTTNVGDAVSALEALTAAGIEAPEPHEGIVGRLRERLRALMAEGRERAAVFARARGPDTLLHGDLWPINVFVSGGRVRLVDWDFTGVGPASYDLSTLVMRYPRAQRPAIVDRYQAAVARAGWRTPAASELEVLLDTAERARYANRVIWPALALLRERADWGFPELAEVERWIEALDASAPIVPT